METLVFLQDFTVEQVKEQLKTSTINLVKNPKEGGSNFFTNSIGTPCGAVSKKITAANLDAPMKFSQVQVVQADAEGKALLDAKGEYIPTTNAAGEVNKPFMLLCLIGEGGSKNVWGTL